MGEHEQYVTERFIEIIRQLAADAIEQVKSELPGCITCDLIDDFGSWYEDYIEIINSKLSDKQIKILREIDCVFDEILKEDTFKCLYIYSEEEIEQSNYKVILESVNWRTIRSLANDLLITMGEKNKKLQQYIQISDNFWRKTE